MTGLTLGDRRFLAIYKRVYGVRYPGDTNVSPAENNADPMAPRHIRGEAMCYLVDLCCFPLGRGVHAWSCHGPSSPSFLAQLRELDGKQEAIDSFYDKDLSDDVIFSDDSPKSPVSKSLFWASDRQWIDKLLEILALPKDEWEAGEKMELLCSLKYISVEVTPGALFEEVVEELIAREPRYAAEGMGLRIEAAWKTLQKIEAVNWRDDDV